MNLNDEIAKVAYELYEKSGRLGGRELGNWLEAEKIVRRRCASKEENSDEGIDCSNTKYAAAEKRKHKRFALKGIESRFPHSANAKVIDISTGGVAIEATKKLEVNKGYSLTIHHKGNPLSLKGRVVWSTLTREEKKESGDIIRIYKGGMKFYKPLLMNSLSNHSSSR
jgi:hypothetical protein